MYAVFATLATCFFFSLPSLEIQARSADGEPSPKIPPAAPEKYKSVRDAVDWANPYLVIRADGIDLISKALPGGRKKIAAITAVRYLMTDNGSAVTSGGAVANGVVMLVIGIVIRSKNTK
jgi:hypothetical protein